MPIQHAVLALLAGGPSYGYELKSSFEESVGPQWGELSIGHLYQVLDRLVRDGLAVRRQVAQDDRPDKNVYRLTPIGRKELEQWLSAPFVRRGGYRDDFFLKLFAASRLGRDALAEVTRVQRAAYLGELKSLAELEVEHAQDPLVVLLVEAARLHTEANLRVVELAEAATDEIVCGEARPAAEETVETVADGMAAHPTLSEAVKEEGLVALGRAIPLPNKKKASAKS